MRNNILSNPFAQSITYWRVEFLLPASAVGTAEESFNDIALTVGLFETDEANHIWTINMVFGEKPDMAEIERRLMVIASLHGVEKPEVVLQQMQQQDWLSQVARDFPPLTIGRFYVHGAHVTDARPHAKIAIQVDAGAAFGSGEHGTTRCCMEALDWLAKQRDFANILDMGTGSGILAIAAAKLWKKPILAVDIGPVSVRVTRENAAINKVTHYIESYVSDGYHSLEVKRGGKYDLIISNILARPLVAFAPHLEKHLQRDGVAVLSGLLVSQQKYVMAAHRAQGLSLIKRFVHEDWCTLVIGR